MTDETEHKLNLRNLTLADFADIKKLMDEVYPGLGGSWPMKIFKTQLQVFQDGQICIDDHGVVVAAAFSVIVDYAKFGYQHTSAEITENA